MIAYIAKTMNLSPLTALGIPKDLPMIPEVAGLLYELSQPKDGKSESEYDEQAQAMQERMDREDSWEQATQTGYLGTRGTLFPVLAPLTLPPILFTELFY